MFHFKQFTILQDRCAMKVCSDACIFAASISVFKNEKILDIGTGTGLLSLFLAQKNQVSIHAVEIDNDAFIQASENIKNSPFVSRIQLFHNDIVEFAIEKYDLIISNPPFFTKNLASPDSKLNKAKHQHSLNLETLSKNIKKRLKPDGRVAIMLPPTEMTKFYLLMESINLYPFRNLQLKHRSDMPVFREIVLFSKQKGTIEKKKLSIRKADNVTFTNEFQSLLRDYYFIF